MHTIVVVGSGFAGMWSALSAMRLIDQHQRNKDVQVKVISPEPTCVIRPRLYESDAESMHASLEDLFRATDIEYIRGRVETIHPDKKQVTLSTNSSTTQAAVVVAYDKLVLAAGSHLNRPAIPGLREHAFSIDQRDEAAQFESHLRSLATQPSSPARNTVVVAGGGFTGIEIASELPARLRSIFGPGEKEDMRVVVVERADDIGPELGPGPRPVIQEALAALGVECRVATALAAVDGTGVEVTTTHNGQRERIDALSTVWTGGMQASPLTRQIPGEHDRLGRLRVNSSLQAVGVSDVFATGDAALACTDDQGNQALMSCQHALFLGRFSGHNAAASLLGLPLKPYSQPVYVTCLDLGPWGAVVTAGWDRKVKIKGQDAKRIKESINQVLIYPPKADRAAAFDAADPDTPGPSF